jgi:dihydrolipoamide dehydrogenase
MSAASDIQMRTNVPHIFDIGKTIHPHPTLGESIGMAAEIAHGSCTDVQLARK